MAVVYTIGYEGVDAARVIETLGIIGVEVVADVRELPLSRKKGLSKKSLCKSLGEVGISYQHFKRLGDPKAGRNAAREGNYLLFERIFLEHFATSLAQAAFDELLKLAYSKVVCIMCFERCATLCHRSYIADQLVEHGVEIINLVADQPEKYLRNDIELPRYRPRESLSPAE